jgi:RES domain-containing protein
MPERPHRLGLPLVAVRKKHFWRCLPSQYLQTVLEAGPSFIRDRRYSVRGEFGALYFSASKELSLNEIASRAGDDAEPMSCVELEVTVDRLVDLTRPGTRTKLHVQLKDLIRPRISKDAYAVPQGIARRVYREKLHGLIAPSVHDPNGEKGDWFNLVLYPANLIRTSIRELRAEDVATQGV